MTGKYGSREPHVIAAATQSNFTGVPEFGTEFYELLSLSCRRQNYMRDLVLTALAGAVNHGFDTFETALIIGSCRISHAYDAFYVAWSHAVQGNPVEQALKQDPPKDQALLNHYTIIHLNADGSYGHRAYADFFRTELAPVLQAFDDMLAVLQILPTAAQSVHTAYIKYLASYRAALAETDISRLESLWCQLDELWCDIKYPIQVDCSSLQPLVYLTISSVLYLYRLSMT